MKLFENMTFDQKMKHLEKCRLNAIECIRLGESAELADIADWVDIWGPWLISECKKLKANDNILVLYYPPQDQIALYDLDRGDTTNKGPQAYGSDLEEILARGWLCVGVL